MKLGFKEDVLVLQAFGLIFQSRKMIQGFHQNFLLFFEQIDLGLELNLVLLQLPQAALKACQFFLNQDGCFAAHIPKCSAVASNTNQVGLPSRFWG